MPINSNAAARIRVLFAVSTMGGGGAERQVLSILQHINRERFDPCLYLIERRGELIEHLPPDVPVFTFAERHLKSAMYFPGRIHRQQVADLATLISQQRV